jgi:hypothetical protein
MEPIYIILEENKLNLDIEFSNKDQTINIKNKFFKDEEKKYIKILNFKNIFIDLYNLVSPLTYISNSEKSILMYNNIIKGNIFNSWLYYKDNFSNNKNYNSLFINQINNINNLEDYMLYRETNSTYSYQDKTELIILKNKKTVKNEDFNIKQNQLNKFLNIYNHIKYSDIVDLKQIKLQNKNYDFIDLNTIYNNEDDYTLILKLILISLKELKKNGFLRLNLKIIKNQIAVDILHLLSIYFYKISIEKSLIQNPFNSEIYINCYKYKKTNLNLITTIDEYIKKNNKKITQIFKNNNNYSNIYKLFELESKNKIYLLDQIMDCYYNLKNNLKNELYYKNIQLNNSIEFAKKNNLIYNFKYQKELDYLKFDQFYKIDIKNHIFKFKKKKNIVVEDFKVTNANYKFDKLDKYENLLKFYKRIMDTLDSNLYNKITYILKKSNVVKDYISKNYSNYKISQAFLKLYEILETFDLLPKNLNRHKVFHICEAPGQFILSTNHFLKTKTKNKGFIWKAQSLNPNYELKNNKNCLEDQYNLINNYPDRWDFGKDNTGDITNNDNIKYYKLLSKNTDLITSDCGFSCDNPYEMIYQDKIISEINFSQILFILNNLPKNGNFVIKVFIPQNINFIVSLNYILYISFKELYFYKPTLNPSSSEIYIIGKGYQKLDDKKLEKLFKLKKNIDINKSFISKLDKDFLNQYEECMIFFIKKNIESIKRSLYYYENFKDFKKYKSIINNNKNLYIKNWLSLFKILKINKKDILNIN